MVFRVEKTSDYTVMSNYHLREKNMSLKAKGLLSWMLSNVDDWDYSITGIVNNCKENESAIKSTLKELQEFGYLEIHKYMPESNTDRVIRSRIEYEYIIHEKSIQGSEIQGIENLPLEIQGVENPGQRNTNRRIIKKEIIKKEDNTQKLIELYNKHCSNLPKVKGLPDKRKKAIQNILKKHTLEDIIQVFDLANNSDFLIGKNDRGWKANIDFIIKEDKFISILEGKYGGKCQLNVKDRLNESGARHVSRFTNEDMENSKKFQEQLKRDGKQVYF